MKITNSFNSPFSFGKGVSDGSKNILKLDSTDNNLKRYDINDYLNESEYNDLETRYNYSKVNFEDLPEGVSRFNHKGAHYTIFKRGENYKSEFFAPQGTDRKAFLNYYPYLEPEKIDIKTDFNSSIDDINQKIDECVLQGNSGDCWLLVALNSLSSTEKGEQIIKDSITINNDNTITVSFKGIGYSYTLTENEIKQYDTDDNLRDSYSNGDNDALIFEIATQKLWKDIRQGKIKLDSLNESINDISNSIENGGYPLQMLYYLTGAESDEYFDLSNNNINNIDTTTICNILTNAYKSGNYSITFGIYDGEHTGQLTDGSQYSLDVGNDGHALSVKNITQDTVTFVNPWDNTLEYTMTYSEFANLGIGYISVCDLNKTNYKEEIIDMTGYVPDNANNEDEKEINDNSDSTYDFYDYEYGYDFNPNRYNYPYGYSEDTFNISNFIDSVIMFFINLSGLFKNNIFERNQTDIFFEPNIFKEKL